MAKEIKNQATNSSEVRNREYCISLVKTGESLGEKLMDLLSQHGASFEGLVIETYAMSKAWAALKAIANSEGYDANELFEQLQPSFMTEMKELLSEFEEEQK